jgi:ABC-type phosphate transport system permease subunit
MKLAFLFFWGAGIAILLVAASITDKHYQNLLLIIVDLFLAIPIIVYLFSLIRLTLKGRKK